MKEKYILCKQCVLNYSLLCNLQRNDVFSPPQLHGRMAISNVSIQLRFMQEIITQNPVSEWILMMRSLNWISAISLRSAQHEREI